MTGLLILLAAFAVPYVALNIRRLRRGRRWAFTVCQVAKEWEQREHDKRLAARAAAARTPSAPAASTRGSGAPSRN
jgi:hypothetical protein